MRSCLRTECWLFYGQQFEVNWKGEKAWYVATLWVDHKLKILLFWSIIFSYSIQQQMISDCDVWWKVNFIYEPEMTSSMIGQRSSSKALPKVKFALKKGSGHCLVVCCPSDLLQLSESQWNHYIWELCPANWWEALETAMPAASFGQQKGPNSYTWQSTTTCHTTNASKVEWISIQSFASSAIFTWPRTTTTS